MQIKGLIPKTVGFIGVFVSRLGHLLPNFSPLGSFGFFGGNFFLFIFGIILFDAFIGGFYKGFIFNYIGFLMYFLFGRIAKGNLKLQLSLLPIASFAFFLISNFGVWHYWYPHTLEGLRLCYTLALPFFFNTLMGDLIFGYGFLFATKVLKPWATNKFQNPTLNNQIPITNNQ